MAFLFRLKMGIYKMLLINSTSIPVIVEGTEFSLPDIDWNSVN